MTEYLIRKLIPIKLYFDIRYSPVHLVTLGKYGTKYSRIDQVKFAEKSL